MSGWIEFTLERDFGGWLRKILDQVLVWEGYRPLSRGIYLKAAADFDSVQTTLMLLSSMKSFHYHGEAKISELLVRIDKISK